MSEEELKKRFDDFATKFEGKMFELISGFATIQDSFSRVQEGLDFLGKIRIQTAENKQIMTKVDQSFKNLERKLREMSLGGFMIPERKAQEPSALEANDDFGALLGATVSTTSKSADDLKEFGDAAELPSLDDILGKKEEPKKEPAPEPLAEPVKQPEPISAPFKLPDSKPEPVVEPPKPEPVVEPPKPQPVVEPPKPQPVVEPPKPELVVEPPKPEPVVEPPKPEPVIEPPKPEPKLSKKELKKLAKQEKKKAIETPAPTPPPKEDITQLPPKPEVESTPEPSVELTPTPIAPKPAEEPDLGLSPLPTMEKQPEFSPLPNKPGLQAPAPTPVLTSEPVVSDIGITAAPKPTPEPIAAEVSPATTEDLAAQRVVDLIGPQDVWHNLGIDIQLSETNEQIALSLALANDNLKRFVKFHKVLFEVLKLASVFRKKGVSPAHENDKNEILKKIDAWKFELK